MFNKRIKRVYGVEKIVGLKVMDRRVERHCLPKEKKRKRKVRPLEILIYKLRKSYENDLESFVLDNGS